MNLSTYLIRYSNRIDSIRTGVMRIHKIQLKIIDLNQQANYILILSRIEIDFNIYKIKFSILLKYILYNYNKYVFILYVLIYRNQYRDLY